MAQVAQRLDHGVLGGVGGRKARIRQGLTEHFLEFPHAAVLACVMFKDWIFPKGLASNADISAAIIDFVIDGINANYDPALK